MRYQWFFAFVLLLAVGCRNGIDTKNKGVKKDPNNTSQNNTTQNNKSDDPDPANCGNGTLDPGELCDPAIADGEGACPDSCQADACSMASMVGSADACTAQCVTEPVACANGDGCCPAGCDSSGDDDCSNVCGDGVTEGPEACDGNCPTNCNDGDACTTDSLNGSAASCSAECRFEPITTCQDGDGCCAPGCDGSNDDDCAPVEMCGNGQIDAGETCDGDCPTSCNDGVACTTDSLVGSAASCNAQCSYDPITVCQDGDGCCPTGCSFDNDDDCACEPRTCASVGAECGTIDDGCGGTVTCSDTCGNNEYCSGTSCVVQDTVGEPCGDYPDCGSAYNSACIIDPAWEGGYCSLICNDDACPSGSHCADFDGTNFLCMLDCNSDFDCDTGYECRDYDGDGTDECTVPAGTGEVGSSCSSSADCADNKACETSVTDSNNNTITFPGGVCSVACVPLVSPCADADTVCALDGLCMPACQDNTDCRPGYECIGGTFPGVSGSYCWPE
jgi:hypothetical protein